MPKNTEPRQRLGRDSQASHEDQAWLDTPAVGREFGSPDYERLTAIDQTAFAAFQSWEKVRHWLGAPNPQLDGACPEDAARSPDGLSKVMSLLITAGGSAGDDFVGEDENLPGEERDSSQGLKGLKSLKGMFGQPSKPVSIEEMNDAIARCGSGEK
jgi:hypothetical protein